MPRTVTVEKVAAALTEVFSLLDRWFELPREELERRPEHPGAWSCVEHLEHLTLANHFLLLTIAKGCGKALGRSAREEAPGGESDLELLAPVAVPGAFDWEPPGHMAPTGSRAPAELRSELRSQGERALSLLSGMANGEGGLCSIRMSVHALGRLDMYQWLYFLAQHGRYHLVLMERLAGRR